MPLVFIHGVNVRLGRRYEIEVLQRNQHFSKIFFKMLGHNIKPENIFNPYWGDLATNLSPGNLFLPSVDAHLPGDRLLSHFLDRDHAGSESHSLLSLAKTAPMSEVFDLMIVAMSESESTENTDEATALSELAYKALGLSKKFKTLEDQLDWLEGVHDDAQLVNKLEDELAVKSNGQHKVLSAHKLHRATDWIKHQSTESMKNRFDELGKRAIEHAKTDLEFAKTDLREAMSDFK